MSGVDFEDHIDQVYRMSDLDSLPLSELRVLYKKAISELKDLKNEFDDF